MRPIVTAPAGWAVASVLLPSAEVEQPASTATAATAPAAMRERNAREPREPRPELVWRVFMSVSWSRDEVWVRRGGARRRARGRAASTWVRRRSR
ncbi:hypothetical protein ACFPRL_20250 [Pseudoclavibacter helvolus]